MGIFDSISKFYSNVDKAVGGILPGGVSSKKKETVKVTKTAPKQVGGVKSVDYSDESGKRVGGSTTYYTPEGKVIKRTVSGHTPSSIQPTTPAQTSPQGTVERYKRSKGGAVSEALGLGSLSDTLRRQRELIRIQKLRGGGALKTKKEAELLGLTALSTLVDFGRDITDLPETALRIIRNPKALKQLPKAIKEQGKQIGELIRVSPGEAFVKIGGEILLLKGTGSALNKVGKLSSSQLTKLSKSYVGEAKLGKTLKIPLKGGEEVKLKVVGKIPKETLPEQISKAGKTIPTAISSQADRLLNILKDTKLLRKPIPGESAFTKETKNLLAKFDAGKITKKELIKLDEAIKQQGAKGLLERSFFADPTGKIRPSRLGVTKENVAKFLDYVSGDITFKKAKPQILLFRNVKVAELPKSLKSLGTKLKKGVALTKSETEKLLKFQLEKSGKFKPLGFVSGESEITLAPGEILKKIKKVGTTIVNGKRVPIVQAEVFKPTGELKSLISKFKANKLTTSQIKKLDNLLKKKTKLNYGLSSLPSKTAKYVDVKKITGAILSKIKKGEKLTTKELKSISRDIPSSAKTPTQRLSYPKPRPRGRGGGSGSTPPRSSSGRFVKKSSLPKSPKSKQPKSSPQKKSPNSRKAISRSFSKSPISPRSLSRLPISRYKPPISRYKPTGYRDRYPIISSSTTPVPASIVKTVQSTIKPKMRGKKTGYLIFEKRAGKYYKVKSKPLSKKDAKDKLAYRIDNKISRTARLIPVKVKSLGSIPRREKGYFRKYKKNLRNYRIVKGKKVKTPLTWIEKKGTGLISTKGEKRQLALNRRAKNKMKKPTSKKLGKKMKRGDSAKTQPRDSHGRFIKKKKREKGGKK